MKKIVDKLWISFKKNSDFWFFRAFLVFSTLSIRKIFYFSPINGQFSDFASISVYLSDILLIVGLSCWIFIQEHKTGKMSSSHFKHPAIWLPLLLVIWSILSIVWADNKYLAVFRTFKLLEFYGLYLFVIFRIVPRGTLFCDEFASSVGNNDRNCSTWNNLSRAFEIIIGIGLFQAIIGIMQFLKQSSIGLFWLKESLISSNMPEVAKIVLDGHKYIRAYGLFPHPNILGGFLAFSIIVTLLYVKMFHSSTNVPRGTFCGARVGHFGDNKCHAEQPKRLLRLLLASCWVRMAPVNCSTWNILLRGRFIMRLILGIQIVAIILTFSKSAILGLVLGLIYLAIVPRGTFNNQNTEFAEKNICRFECSEANSRNPIRSFDSSEADSLKMTFKKCFEMFHVEHSTEQTWNILYRCLWLLLVFQILITILFMSKMALFGLLVLLMIIVALKLFHVEHYQGQSIFLYCYNLKKYYKLIALGVACFVLIIYIIKPSYQSLVGNSIVDRLGYVNVSRGTILVHPILGIGTGQYVPYLNSLNNLLDWQYQPVHNVFLLVWAELGLIGLGVFIIFLSAIFKNVPRGTLEVFNEKGGNCAILNSSMKFKNEDKAINSDINDDEKRFTSVQMFHSRSKKNVPRGTICGAGVEHPAGQARNNLMKKYFTAVLIALIFVSFFDHYLWDIQQGQIILWMVLGLVMGSRKGI